MPDVQIAKIRVRQGTDAERKQIVLETGELGFTIDTHRLVVGNGTTVGGVAAGARSYVVSGADPVPSGILPGDYVYNSTTSVINILPTDFNVTNQPTWGDFYSISQGTVSVSGAYLTQAGSVISLTPNSIDAGALNTNLFTANNPVVFESGNIKLKYSNTHFTSGVNGLNLNQVPGALITNGSVPVDKINAATLSPELYVSGGLLRIALASPALNIGVNGIGLAVNPNQISPDILNNGRLTITSINGNEVNLSNIPASAISSSVFGNGLQLTGANVSVKTVGPLSSSPLGVSLNYNSSFTVAGNALALQSVPGNLIQSGTASASIFNAAAIGSGIEVINGNILNAKVDAPLYLSANGISLLIDNTLQVSGSALGIKPGAATVSNFSGFDTSATEYGFIVSAGQLRPNTQGALYASQAGIGINCGTGIYTTSANRLEISTVPTSAIAAGTITSTQLSADTLSAWQYKAGGIVTSPISAYQLSSVSISALNEAAITITETLPFGKNAAANAGVNVVPSVAWGAKLPPGVVHAQTRLINAYTVEITLFNATAADVLLTSIPFRIMCITDGVATGQVI